MRKGVAYKLTFPNGKVYIGITRGTLSRRIKCHISYARSGKHFALSAAIRKYGEDSFTSEIVGTGTWDELTSIEVLLIAQYKSLGSGGYNMTGGGEGSLGVPVAESVKAKISRALAGRKLSDEHRQRVGAAQLGKVIQPETREKMSASALGRVISDDQRNKVSAALKGRKQSPELVAKRVAARRANGSY